MVQRALSQWGETNTPRPHRHHRRARCAVSPALSVATKHTYQAGRPGIQIRNEMSLPLLYDAPAARLLPAYSERHKTLLSFYIFMGFFSLFW